MGEARLRGTFAERKQRAIMEYRGKHPPLPGRQRPWPRIGKLTKWLVECTMYNAAIALQEIDPDAQNYIDTANSDSGAVIPAVTLSPQHEASSESTPTGEKG